MMFRNADRTKAVLRAIGTGELSGRDLRRRVVGDVWWRRPGFYVYLMGLEDLGLVVGRTVVRHVDGIGNVTERWFRLSDAGRAAVSA